VWKKNEPEPSPRQIPKQPSSPRPESPRGLAAIGPSIFVKGNLTGEEDLLIEGRVEGKIVLKKNSVSVGRSGRVKADIHGNSIRVDGEVQGNLIGEKEIVIRASGQVEGNLVAPSITLENGSRFKGSIDMEAGQSRTGSPQPSTSLDSPDSGRHTDKQHARTRQEAKKDGPRNASVGGESVRS